MKIIRSGEPLYPGKSFFRFKNKDKNSLSQNNVNCGVYNIVKIVPQWFFPYDDYSKLLVYF